MRTKPRKQSEIQKTIKVIEIVFLLLGLLILILN